ncbi:ANTAR domain-containing protein [Vibrio cholerae]|nr:ANTAR domain-containing protein [Vibrio cholerae]
MDLVDQANRLYALPLDEFTAARNAAATSARKEGDRELASALRALPKAASSAWLVNVLVTRRRDEIEQVLELGASLREAQSGVDRAHLQALGQQRQRLLSAVARQSLEAAAELGHDVGPAALPGVEQTLRAALADPAAAAAVLTGRLVRTLEASGWDPVDLTGAVGGPFEPPGTGPVEDSEDDAPPDRHDGPRPAGATVAAQRRKRAENRLQAAGEARRTAEDAAAELRQRAKRLSVQRDGLTASIEDLQERLDALRRELADLDAARRCSAGRSPGPRTQSNKLGRTRKRPAPPSRTSTAERLHRGFRPATRAAAYSGTDIRGTTSAGRGQHMTELDVLSDVNDELFSLLTETDGIQEFLDEFAVVAARRLSTRGDVSCAVTLIRRKRAGTLAVSDAVARRADEFQNRSGEGPCLEAAETGRSVYCSDTTTDPRWRTYLSRLDTAQVRSILGVPIALEGSGWASLNVYASLPEAFPPASIKAAVALAEAASSSLRFALRAATAGDEQHDLEAALVSRKTINTAVGIIMFQNRCSQADALAILQRASSSRNLKLRLVAERVVESTTA